MRQYIIRRILISLIILFGVSIVMYAVIRIMPGDYVQTMITGKPDINPAAVERMYQLYGLDTGIIEGYANWLVNALKGDFGESFLYKQPVFQVIGERMWVSFWMAFIAFVFTLIIAIPLGIISATKQYSKLDYAVTTFALFGISLPGFFFSAILQRFFAIQLKWFPLSGMITARANYEGFDKILDIGWHLVLPIFVFVVTGLGSLMRYSRTNMLEVINADYVRTARAKGLSEKTVIYKHAFRNTLIPIVTMVGGSIPGLFSGAIITENIFAINGVGHAALKAMMQGDIPFMMGFNMFLAVLTLLGNLISDILYAVVDPRVHYS